MRHKFEIKSLALGALLGAVVVLSVAATTTWKSAWDYKIISGHLRLAGGPDEPLLGQQLDQAAADGWDVVSAANDEGRPFVILRRTRPPQDPPRPFGNR